MGLLDIFASTGDPERDAARNRGLLAAGLQLMQAKGRLFPALGQAGMAGVGAADQYAQQSQAQQARPLQQRMAQLQMQQLQREEQIADLPRQVTMPGGGPAMDATGGMDTATENPNNIARPGGLNLAEYFRRLQGIDPVRAAKVQEMLTPKKPNPIVSKPGDVARDEQGNVLWQNPSAPDSGKQTKLAQLIAERDALPANSPMRRWYEDAIKKETTHQEGVNVSFGSPIPAINPKTGEPEFVRPDNKGGMNFTGVRPPPQNRDTKMPAEIQRMNIAADTMEKQLTRYETWLKSNNPRDPTVQMSPARRAEMQSLMKNLQLQYKELAALGALTGPDLDLMEKALSDPFSVRGAFYGKDGLLSQIGQARELVKERREAMAKSQAPQSGGNVVDFGSLK